MVMMYRNSVKLRLGSKPLPQTSRMSSNVGEGQTVARISVKDRLGPLPTAGRSAFKRRRGRSVEGKNHNGRRGRKYSKSLEEPDVVEFESPVTSARIPVHERLGALPPPQQQHQQQHQQQLFKRSDHLFHKRNRQQVWKHQDYKEVPQQQSKEEFIPETENVNPPFIKPPAAAAAAVPSVPLRAFNAEQHRQAWTWVRPGTNSSAAMDVDESDDKLSS